VQLAIEKALAVKGANLSVTIDADAIYSFTFDMSNRSAPVLSIEKTDMFAGKTVFIRGGMNAWGEVDALVYQGSSVYQVDITLAAGDNEFKIATADWSSVDLGAIAGDDTVIDGKLKTLAKKGANLHVNATSAGTYRFTVTGPSTESPSLLVTKLN
jgi:pullulanase